MLVFECSGCALDHLNGNQQEGARLGQWNPYREWSGVNRRFVLDEPLFCEAETGNMILEGDARVGEVLIPSDPAKNCIPRNCAGTSGLVYRATWYRGESPGERVEVCRNASSELGYSVCDEDEGFFLTCVVTAQTHYGDVPYRGEVVLSSEKVKSSQCIVRCFVDGSTKPCFEDACPRGRSYEIPSEAVAAARKPICSIFDGWYIDALCTMPFRSGEIIEENLDLFARNKAVVWYRQTEVSCFENTTRRFYRDAALSEPVDAESMLPSKFECWYGDRAIVGLAASVWFEDRGRAREALCRGGFASSDAQGTPFSTLRIFGDTVIYLDWRPRAYDGVAIS